MGFVHVLHLGIKCPEHTLYFGVFDTAEVRRAPEAKPEDLKTVLNVSKIDLHIAANTKLHKTDKYICTKDREIDEVKEEAELVLRRGQAFKMTLTFDRPYDKARDDLRVVFNTGKIYSGVFFIHVSFSDGLAYKIMLNFTFYLSFQNRYPYTTDMMGQ